MPSSVPLPGCPQIPVLPNRYAALQKRNAVSAVLDFTDEEWESLKTMKEADAASRSNTAVADAVNNDTGVFFLTDNETLSGKLGAL